MEPCAEGDVANKSKHFALVLCKAEAVHGARRHACVTVCARICPSYAKSHACILQCICGSRDSSCKGLPMQRLKPRMYVTARLCLSCTGFALPPLVCLLLQPKIKAGRKLKASTQHTHKTPEVSDCFVPPELCDEAACRRLRHGLRFAAPFAFLKSFVTHSVPVGALRWFLELWHWVRLGQHSGSRNAERKFAWLSGRHVK